MYSDNDNEAFVLSIGKYIFVLHACFKDNLGYECLVPATLVRRAEFYMYFTTITKNLTLLSNWLVTLSYGGIRASVLSYRKSCVSNYTQLLIKYIRLIHSKSYGTQNIDQLIVITFGTPQLIDVSDMGYYSSTIVVFATSHESCSKNNLGNRNGNVGAIFM